MRLLLFLFAVVTCFAQTSISTINDEAMPGARTKINNNFSSLNTNKIEGLASSVDGEAAVFDGITGKLIKRFAGSGVGIFSSGVLSTDSGLQFNGTTKALGVFGPIVSGQTSNYLGQFVLNGITSGAVTIQPANAAGTWTLTLPNSGGTNGQVWTTDGSGGSSWTNPLASGLTAQYIDWNAASGGSSIANKPTLGTAAAATLGTGAGQVPVTGDYQPSDSDLTAIAALACSENQIIKRNGSGAWICAADATGGSPTFDQIGAGTNTTAAMVVGTGGSLAATGSGTISATSAAALAAQYIDWNASSGGTSIANKPNVATAASGGSLTTSGAHAVTLTATGATNVTLPTSGTLLAVSGSGTGVIGLLEGTAPGAGSSAGEHNLYFDSADSRLKSHENGGSVVTYYSTANPQTTISGNAGTATALATPRTIYGTSFDGSANIGSRSGNTTEMATVSGTKTTGKQLAFDANGNVVASASDIGAGGSMVYPGAGVPNSTGSAWDTSYAVGTAANNLVQLNGSAQLPAVSAALLTNFPTLNQNTTGTAAALAANGTNCSAGQAARGVDAAGNAEDCFTPMANPMTTAQDIIVGGTSGAPARLGVGSEGQVLKVTSGVVGWGTDSTGGSPAFSDVGAGTNTNALVVGTGGSLGTSGSGTIAATTSAALAANGTNCSAGQAARGVDASGAAEDCFAVTTPTSTDTLTNKTLTTPIIGSYTVANLPAAGTAGRIAVVTDASEDGDCNTGGGSSTALCRDTGAAWARLGDGQASGSSVTASSTDTFTNKTIDAAGTGNEITLPGKISLPLVACAGTTGTLMWDTLATLAPTASCSAGSTNTNMMRGVANFPDEDGDYSVQLAFPLPDDWASAKDLSAKFFWRAGATSGDVVWQVQTACAANDELDDVAWNTANTVTDTALGTANRLNTASISALTKTGCAAGEVLHLRVLRNRTHASDSITGVVSLGHVELTIWRTM